MLWHDITDDGVRVTISHTPEVSIKLPVKVPPPAPVKFCIPSTAYVNGVVSALSDLYVTITLDTFFIWNGSPKSISLVVILTLP